MYDWLMFKTGDSEDVEDEKHESIHHQRIDNEDVLNGNLMDDCFEDINRNFVTPTRPIPELSDASANNSEGNLILIGELNVLKG